MGQSIEAKDLKLKHSMNYDDITLNYGDFATFDGDKITFVKAGDFELKAKSGKLKASLSIKVKFNNVDEYFDFGIKVGGTTNHLYEDDIVVLYLPSQDEDEAAANGYYNSAELTINYKQDIYSYIAIMSKDILTYDEGKFVAKELGKTKIDIYFAGLGKSISFWVEVRDIVVVSLTTTYDNDTIYASKGEIFDIFIECTPAYATNKQYSVELLDEGITFSGDKYFAEDIGSHYILCRAGEGFVIIKVVVCDIPDEIRVNIYDEFVYDETGRASIMLYKDNEVINGYFDFEFYIDGVKVDRAEVLEEFTFSKNILRAKVITQKRFCIKVLSHLDSSVSFEIWGNN